ncbi:MAG: SBBP repeat-containing protein, partial [Gemmataceae bacterium]|nr:SBBP repeat-containing protein [Gemmataceae bacterium]
STLSVDFPTVNPVQGGYSGASDGFIAKVNRTGTVLVYSSYLGGQFADEPADIAVDARGNAYVVGETGSADFPTTPGSYQPAYGGGDCDIFQCQDGFVTKVAG